MKFRKFCSLGLCLAVLLSIGAKQVQPAFAMDAQTIPDESQQTEVPVEATDPQPSGPQFQEETIEETVVKETASAELDAESETSAPTKPECEDEQPIGSPSEPPDAPSTPESGEYIPDSTKLKETEPTPTEPAGTEPKHIPDASAQDTDLSPVSGQGITFQLFNYSTKINKAAGGAGWRPISRYFTFRDSSLKKGADALVFEIPSVNENQEHDKDGFTKNHATVERILNGGYPVLDLSRNADGSPRSDPAVESSVRSLRYLFSSGDHAVTAYSPVNTILRQNGNHYWYDSAANAVDYDVEENCFRLRSYTERNSTTASYGAAYGDFLPFTHTEGTAIGNTGGVAYHIDTNDTDYWFGMTMQVNFFQTKNGKLGEDNMIFRFSGDDDVWVFVDDVLVLDLGGTHGTVNGSIDFATGQVLQYLSWSGANSTTDKRVNGSSTSFPTTVRACFDAAGRTPNGGWSADGKTFADFTEHTLTLFYLERGAAVANCSLDFRLPTLPDKSLTVTKDMLPVTDSSLRDYISDSLYYDFRVMKADDAGNATDTPFLVSGTTYTLLEYGNVVGTGVVGEDNCFRLKAGQSAQFTQMLQKGNGAVQYVVEEIMPSKLAGQYGGIEYLVDGVGGDTVTEDHPAEAFTAFQTAVLSSKQTQTVTFRNKVDTAKLGTLIISKLAAPGTQIPPDLYFKLQVTLGDTLLPAGTRYTVSGEERFTETAGILYLRADETAQIETGILSGTKYQVTELSAALDGYRPTYDGIVLPEGEVRPTPDGISGEFPLAGTVHITITNADYDFFVQIPINKSVVDFQQTADFSFLIEQVELSDDTWRIVKTLPEQIVSVDGTHTSEGMATIGYQMETEGIFYYRITEKTEQSGYFYDTSIFLVEVTVSDGDACVTNIWKNGTAVDAISFVNREVTTLTVTKTISGGGQFAEISL